MPAFRKTPPTTGQKVALSVIGLLAAGALVLSNEARIIGLGLALFLAVHWLFEDFRLRRLSAEREGEDIGTFVRAFDRRSPEFDPCVIRAVWDALQPYRTHRGGSAPLRPSDRLNSFMAVDDIGEVVAPEIAERARRSMDTPEANPRYGRVETVEDLVRFFWDQPRCQEQPDRVTSRDVV
jgi:hypothetical protein